MQTGTTEVEGGRKTTTIDSAREQGRAASREFITENKELYTGVLSHRLQLQLVELRQSLLKLHPKQDVERLVETEKYKAIIAALQSTLQSTIRNQGKQSVAEEAPPPMERSQARQVSPQYNRYDEYRHTAYQREGFPDPPHVNRSQDGHGSQFYRGNGNRERGHRFFSAPKSMIYDGHGSWQAFIAKFNLYAEEYGWDLSHQRNQLCWCLGGSASEYFALLVKREPHLGYMDLVRKLEKRFASRELPESCTIAI